MDIQRAQAVLFGLAVGDALGYPVEFNSLEEIKQIYGPNGILEPPDPAHYTDDTQMTIALAEGLLEFRGIDIAQGDHPGDERIVVRRLLRRAAGRSA